MNKHSVVEVAYRFLVVIGLLTFSLSPAPARAEQATPGVRYASPGGLTSGACDAWPNACDLQTALALAVSGEEVWVQQGVYKPTSGTDRAISFGLKNGVALYGGFAGAETAREQRDWGTHVTVLSGDIDNNDLTDPTGVVTNTANITGTNSYHVVTGSGATEMAVLDGFFITAGSADGAGVFGNGGGMYTNFGGPALANITFSGNLAIHEGGGMANYNCSGLALTQVTFTGNWSGFDGGGLYSKNCSTMQVTDAIFRDNIAINDGGGMKNYASDPQITRVIFKENSARYGGGLFNGFNENGSPTLVDVVFSGNQADQGGGMFEYYYSSPTLTNVTFSGNRSTKGGGGMRNWNHSSPILTNVTFAGNSTGAEGSAIYNGDGSNPLLQNVIAWNNTSSVAGPAIFNYDGYEVCIPTIRYSLVEGCNPGGVWENACGTDGGNNLTDIDPLFIAPEPASSAPTTQGDYRLQNASLAINAGDNAADLDGNGPLTMTISDISPDLDGNPRIVLAVIDLGSYENQAFPCPTGGVVYVDEDATGAQSGASWSDAFISLQDALYVSNDCEIRVAEGAYYPDKDSDYSENKRTATFRLKSGVAIYGGFNGTETTREERNWTDNITVLSGDIDGNDLTDPNGVVTTTTGIMGTNSYHVLNGSSVTETARLDGFTVTGGSAIGDDAASQGGGMYIATGSPALANVIFSGNSAFDGGGMYNTSSSPMLTNITFSNNSAFEGGGGMLNNMYSQPMLLDVTFSGNQVEYYGGGMYNGSWASPVLTDVTFSDNQAGNNGGGMYNYWTSPTLTNVLFSGNSAISSWGGETSGGGMYNFFNSSPTLTNVAFSGNQADYGGGMWNESGSNPTLTNITFSSNLASIGGGMYNAESSPTLSNSILWANTPEQVFNNSGSHPSFTYNDVQGGCPAGSTCIDLMNADPLFVDAAGGDLRLSPGSPAIDAGNTAYITATLDLAGGPRFVDIPAAPNTGLGTPPLVDMGAYEANFVDAGMLKTVSPLEAIPGQPITYTLTFSNGGSLPAVGVVIADAVPSFLTIQGVEFGGVAITDTGHLPPYAWAVQNLTAGQGGTITFTAILSEPLAAGIYTNTALITATEDAGEGNNRSDIGLHVLNVAPLAVGDGYTTLEDTPLQIAPDSVLANDSDDNGDALTAIKNSVPGHGLLALNLDGSFVYTPTLNTNGSDSFTYHAYDGGLNSNIATVNLSITSVNDAPAGTNQTLSTLEDVSYTFALADFGFTDPHDNPANKFYRVKVNSLPAQGILKLSETTVTADQFVTAADITAGKFVFSPVANANGAPYASFTFQVEDDGGTANGGANLDPTPNTLTMHVTSVNDAPVGMNQTVTTLEDVSYTFALADFGFTDPLDSPANSFNRVQITTLPGQGILRLNGTVVTVGQFVTVTDITANRLAFTPALDANGTPYASFTFQVEDDGGMANGGVNLDPTPNTLTIDVTSVNESPVITEGDSISITMDEDGSPTPFDLTLHATDVDDDTFTWHISIAAAHGTASASGAGAAKPIGYTLNTNYNGTDQFEVQVSDGLGGEDMILVNVTIQAVNDAPVAVGDSYTTTQNTSLALAAPGILANDMDIDGSPLAAILDSDPAHGLLSLNPNGSFVYTPTLDYYGPDSFTCHASDGVLDSDIVTVTLTVQQVYRIFLPVVQRNDEPQSRGEAPALADRFWPNIIWFKNGNWQAN